MSVTAKAATDDLTTELQSRETSVTAKPTPAITLAGLIQNIHEKYYDRKDEAEIKRQWHYLVSQFPFGYATGSSDTAPMPAVKGDNAEESWKKLSVNLLTDNPHDADIQLRRTVLYMLAHWIRMNVIVLVHNSESPHVPYLVLVDIVYPYRYRTTFCDKWGIIDFGTAVKGTTWLLDTLKKVDEASKVHGASRPSLASLVHATDHLRVSTGIFSTKLLTHPTLTHQNNTAFVLRRVQNKDEARQTFRQFFDDQYKKLKNHKATDFADFPPAASPTQFMLFMNENVEWVPTVLEHVTVMDEMVNRSMFWINVSIVKDRLVDAENNSFIKSAKDMFNDMHLVIEYARFVHAWSIISVFKNRPEVVTYIQSKMAKSTVSMDEKRLAFAMGDGIDAKYVPSVNDGIHWTCTDLQHKPITISSTSSSYKEVNKALSPYFRILLWLSTKEAHGRFYVQQKVLIDSICAKHTENNNQASPITDEKIVKTIIATSNVPHFYKEVTAQPEPTNPEVTVDNPLTSAFPDTMLVDPDKQTFFNYVKTLFNAVMNGMDSVIKDNVAASIYDDASDS